MTDEVPDGPVAEMKATPAVRHYYDLLQEKTNRDIDACRTARQLGFDLVPDIETRPARDLADRCESIIGPVGVAKRYRELFAEKKDRNAVIFQLFREIIEQQWVSIPDEQKRLEQAIRTGLVLITEGVVVAPLDGVPKILISTNPDGTRFVDIYFAGPIRAAGGTATVFPLILGDYARKLMDLGRYLPTQAEIERYVEECDVYDEIVSRQYKLKPDEVRKIISNCPVCINGEPTEEREVSVNRDVPRIPTNRVRGGMCLVVSEGVALKAMKILSFSKQLGLDWSWLEEIIKIEKKSDTEITIKPNDKYLERLAAGRPIFAYPSRWGGFRLRYGRSRNTAAMGKAIHPATMIATDEFIAVGTQLKIERPGKAAGIFPCDSIEGPIVLLFSGEVRKLDSNEEAMRFKPQIDKILYLGDILITVGDFRKSGHPLLPVGYCEEWWALEIKKALFDGKKTECNTDAALLNPRDIDFETAVALSNDLGVPLHPEFTHYFGALEKSALLELRDAIRTAQPQVIENESVFCVPNAPKVKESLEKIGCSHRVSMDKTRILFADDVGKSLRLVMGPSTARVLTEEEIASKSILELLNLLSPVLVRDKAGTFIGGRMGRPEAAKPREMVGNPHILFPIGFAGGPTRSINKAAIFNEKNASNENAIEAEIVLFKCDACQQILTGPHCFECNKKTRPMFFCKACNVLNFTDKCYKCNGETTRYNQRKLDVAKMLSQAGKNLGIKVPDLVKGVRGMSNEFKVIEPLEKGLLRSVYNLHVFRDATIRYEMLNAPLTHFKPWEIG
ncbi:MAG: DNA polymerase II large subunit, partial [Candidatus Diapherotrites archaeon]|nr:DNA polymerase II large subunit [Candidatus Diapherotrites archaeon]